MSSKTKILILKKKEILYTIVFVILALLLFFLLYFMFFRPKSDGQPDDAAASASVSYIPGVYTTSVTLGDEVLDVEVAVDADHINSIRLVELNEAVTTMYPLVGPAIDNLAMQIIQTQSLESVSYSKDTQYTSSLLLNAIETTLQKAAPAASK